MKNLFDYLFWLFCQSPGSILTDKYHFDPWNRKDYFDQQMFISRVAMVPLKIFQAKVSKAMVKISSYSALIFDYLSCIQKARSGFSSIIGLGFGTGNEKYHFSLELSQKRSLWNLRVSQFSTRDASIWANCHLNGSHHSTQIAINRKIIIAEMAQ